VPRTSRLEAAVNKAAKLLEDSEEVEKTKCCCLAEPVAMDINRDREVPDIVTFPFQPQKALKRREKRERVPSSLRIFF